MTGLRAFLRRLAGMARARHHERDLDDQIAAHLAEATDDYIAGGLSPEDARLAALRDFGGVTQAKQVHREVRSFTWPDNLRQDLSYTWRSLARAPGFTLIVVSTLALGIGVNIAIFTLLDAVVFKPLPVPAPHELVALYEHAPGENADVSGGSGTLLRFSYPRFERLRHALGADGSIAAVTRGSLLVVQLPGETQAQFLQGQLVSGGYFSTLGISAARGRALTANDVTLDAASPVAVVSDAFWRRDLGGSDRAIGQVITVNGVGVTIVGVMPPGFVGIWSDLEADVWLPASLHRQLAVRFTNTTGYGRLDEAQTWLTQDLIAWVNIVARIPPVNRAPVVARLQAANQQGLGELAARQTDPEDRTELLAHTLAVTPLAHGFSGLRGGYADALFALTGLVVLVLLVACANIANLLLARGAAQARDVSLRLSLGASTGRLVQQRLIESLTLAIIGGTAGVILGTWASRLLAREVLGRSGDVLPIVFAPDSRVVIFAATVTIGTALLFGLAPALRTIAMGRRVSLSTQRIAVGHMKRGGMRALVVGQLALSVVVVFAAVVLGRTLVNFLRIDPGFPTDRLLVAALDPVTSRYTRLQQPALSQRLLDAVRAVPGVTSAATSMCGLLTGCASSSPYRIEGVTPGVSLRQNWISPSYFATTGIPLLHGREFHERDTQGSAQVAIVNEAFVRRFFAGQNPVGRRLGRQSGQGQEAPLTIEIVGVVRNARTVTLQEELGPVAYFPIPQWGTFLGVGVSSLAVRADGNPRAIIAAVRSAIREAEPNLLLVNVSTMSARLSRHLSREHIVAYLSYGFAALTLLLASLGLYGVLAYGVARQTQEIGVRMALGARRSQVLQSVLGQSARLTIAGITPGLVAATAGAGYLSTMLFGVTPRDPWTFISVVITFAAVTTLAAFVPARRATAIDPVVALRHE